MFGIVTLHTENYQKLADITWNKNKLEYAAKHGYTAFCQVENFKPGSGPGYHKIYLIAHILANYPDLKWLWWTGTDSLITNMYIKLQHKVHDQYHFMMSVDFNGINSDSFLIRNSEEGRKIIDDLIKLEPECSQHWDQEQRALAMLFGLPLSDHKWEVGPDVVMKEEYKNIVKILPQNYMNSYNYELYYPHYPCHDDKDKLGYNGNWKPGDWLIHWPATSLEQRIDLANHYTTLVVN